MAKELEISEDITCLQIIEAHSSDVTACDFGNDALLATASGDRTARLWRWAGEAGAYEESPCSPLEGHKYAVATLCFSPQATMLATASVDGTTILWNVATGTRLQTLVPLTGGAIRTLRFAPDSQTLLTAGDDGAVCMWDLLRRTIVRCIWAHEGAVHALAPTPDGRLILSGCSLGAVRVWALADSSSGTPQPPASPQRSPNSVAGGPSALETPLAQVDDAHDLGVLAGDVSPLQSLVEAEDDEDWSRGGEGDSGRRLVHCYLAATGGNDHLVRLWEIRSPACDGGCGGGGAPRAALRPCPRAHTLSGHGSAVTAVRFAPASAFASARSPVLVSAGLDKTARLWQVETGSCVAVVSGHSRFVASACVSRCGSLLATASNDRSVRVWALQGDRRPPPPPPRRALHRSAAPPPPGSEDALIKRAEVEGAAPSLVQRLQPEDCGAVNGLAFGPHGRLLAAAHGDKLLRLWSRSGRVSGGGGRFAEAPCSPLEAHRYSVLACEFVPLPSPAPPLAPPPLLASCSLDGEALLWDVQMCAHVTSNPLAN